MPYAVLEKEMEKLDEEQQNTVALFVRFVVAQKAAAESATSHNAPDNGGSRARRFRQTAASGDAASSRGLTPRTKKLRGCLKMVEPVSCGVYEELKDSYFAEKYGIPK